MRPMRYEYVNVVDNESMRSVGKGRVIQYTPAQIVLEPLRRGSLPRMFNAKTHHFEGYEPPFMLVKKEGKLIRKEN